MLTTLDRILAATRESLSGLRARRKEIEAEAARAPLPRGFCADWKPSRVALVAEVKRRSPSAGTISADLDPTAHAAAYAKAGASAISVLTDGPFFGGSLADLVAVTRVVALPVLRKDFILDELQIAEARSAGAAAVLLIVRALPADRLASLLRAARDFRVDAVVEAHDDRELDAALEAGAGIIGVNSRNLDDFHIDLDAAWALIARIPPERVVIAESGMASVADVRRAAQAGADAVLLGTALSSAADPTALAAECAGVARIGR
jgi:indole-3-glycerol phosphate synthase